MVAGDPPGKTRREARARADPGALRGAHAWAPCPRAPSCQAGRKHTSATGAARLCPVTTVPGGSHNGSPGRGRSCAPHPGAGGLGDARPDAQLLPPAPSPSPSVSLRTGHPRFSAAAYPSTAKAYSPVRTHRSRSPRCDFYAGSTSETRQIRCFWAWLTYSP